MKLKRIIKLKYLPKQNLDLEWKLCKFYRGNLLVSTFWFFFFKSDKRIYHFDVIRWLFPYFGFQIRCWFSTIKTLWIGSARNVGVQPWESAAAVGNVVVNAVLWGIYDGKKIAAVRFSMSVEFIFTTYIIVDYFWKIN